jgi:hypothetical protein
MSEKSVLVQCKRVHNAADPDDFNLYKKIPTTGNSKHGLCKWASKRAEPGLEKYHETPAHFANTGLAVNLADILNLEGTGEWNAKCRQMDMTNQKKLQGERIEVPVHFEDQPRYWDHSLHLFLNGRAEQKGIGPVFEGVNEIKPDNGEKFVSGYRKQQLVRNRRKQNDNKTKLCTC